MIITTCTNGNSRNGISGSRVRWTCSDCDLLLAEHHSPQGGPAGRYETKHPGGGYAADYWAKKVKVSNHRGLHQQ